MIIIFSKKKQDPLKNKFFAELPDMGRLSKQLAKAAAVLRTPKQATKQVRGIVHAGKLSISSPVHLKGTKSPLYDRLNTILRSEPEEDDEDERKQYLLSPVYDQIKSPPDGTTANVSKPSCSACEHSSNLLVPCLR